jgi:hypothetical protein
VESLATQYRCPASTLNRSAPFAVSKPVSQAGPCTRPATVGDGRLDQEFRREVLLPIASRIRRGCFETE